MTNEPDPSPLDTGSAPIFVVGAGRSGTTLLRLMLNEHPDIAIPSEAHFIGPLIRTFGPSATLSAASLETALTTVIESPEWQRDFDHTPQELREAVGEGPLSLAAFIERVFRLEVGPEPAHWGDKTPPNLYWVPQLLECFPGAQIIAIVRDPRDVYLSLASLQWFGDTTWSIGRYIARNGKLIEKWLGVCPPEQLHVVRYEDLVSDAESTLRRLCDDIRVPFAPEMVTFYENTRRNVHQWELDGFHQKLLRPPASDDIARWRREGSRRDHAEIEAVTIDIIDKWGYERNLARAWLPVVRAEARVRHHLKERSAPFRRSLSRLGHRTRTAARPAGANRRGSRTHDVDS
jgi:sulfotransferase family protein